MAHKSEVALHGRVYRVEVDQPGLVLFRYVAHTCLHFLDRLSCRFAVPRIDSAAHEGDPVLDESDRGFAVQFEVQDFVQILLDRSPPPVQCGCVRIEQRHVVHVSVVKMGFQLVLDILIQLIEADVRE